MHGYFAANITCYNETFIHKILMLILLNVFKCSCEILTLHLTFLIVHVIRV